MTTDTEAHTARQLYLDLLKRALTNWIHGHEELAPVDLPRKGMQKALAKWSTPDGAMLMKAQHFDEQKRKVGQDWPAPLFAHTMIGMMRLDNLQQCIERVIADKVPGDLIETGVWKGGATILMRGVLKAYGEHDRRIWVADSFEGLPPPDPEKYPADAGDIHHTIDELRITVEQVKQNFAAYGLLDDSIMFLKGWFDDTLPKAPIEKLSILRLDGDMYQSTMVAFKSLYPKLSVGGFVIVDDYCIPSCEKAVTDFRAEMNITDEIIDIDGTGVYWRRTA